MEHTPGSPDGTHTFLNTINSDAFQEALRDAHNWLRHPDERTANDIKSLIGDELPTSYCDLPLRVVGLMYDADAVLSRAQNKNVSFPSVDTTPKHPMGMYNAQLWGIQIVTLEGEAQIVLDIRLNTTDENDPNTRRQTRFFLIPDSDNIADIEFGEASYAEFTPEPSLEPTDTITENPELTDTIAGLADSSRDVIESPEFSSMSAADRRAILEAIERNATQALLEYLDADEDIACVTNNFYIIPDGASMKHCDGVRT